MNDHLFSHQHEPLLDSQCSDLGSVWRRAAQNRQEDAPADDPEHRSALRWVLPAVGVVAAAGYLMSVWLDDRVEEPQLSAVSTVAQP